MHRGGKVGKQCSLKSVSVLHRLSIVLASSMIYYVRPCYSTIRRARARTHPHARAHTHTPLASGKHLEFPLPSVTPFSGPFPRHPLPRLHAALTSSPRPETTRGSTKQNLTQGSTDPSRREALLYRFIGCIDHSPGTPI